MAVSGGGALLERFPLKLHREFLFQGFLGHSARVAVYRGVLYWCLTVILFSEHKESLFNLFSNSYALHKILHLSFGALFIWWLLCAEKRSF
jgi:hypothetical protein